MSIQAVGTKIILIMVVMVSMFQCCTAHTVQDLRLPLPTFSMNITQDDDIGVEKRVYRRLGAAPQENEDGSTAPLFEGLGTHYSFIWVGTPPQRVSVIMDTGSHHTAFPCTGCKCGKHMDPHFDPKRSSSNTIKSCGGDKKCYFKQSYTEGSSWSAFKVRDKVWVGGPGAGDVESAEKKSIDFDFGCQESETGLFRTQKVDGIMGLSAAADTLPYQLHAAGTTKTKMFGLCFRHGGGVVTLGGVDTSLHVPSPIGAATQQHNRTSIGGVYFAALIKPKGWYTVKVVDVLMRPQQQSNTNSVSGTHSADLKSVGGDVTKYNAGKGTIVDSGTTDTYLPSALKAQFQTLFRAYSGREFNNKQTQFSKEQFAKLPVIVFRMMAAGGSGVVDLEVFPSSYMELHRDGPNAPTTSNQGGRYTPRIYLTEGSGAVIGANAINEHNVIFDPDNMRVGFARSTCSYEKSHSGHDFATSTNGTPQIPVPVKAAAKATPTKAASGPTAPVVEGKAGSAAQADPVAPIAKPSTPAVKTIPKAKTPVKAKPKHSTNSGTKTGTSKSRTPASSKLDLTSTQKKAFMTVIRRAADAFVNTHYSACKPVLAMPCNARCDRMPFSDPMIPDMGIISHSDSELEYLHVNSRGEVSVVSAILVQGQQFWKVPSCGDADNAAAVPRRLHNSTATATNIASLRGSAGIPAGSRLWTSRRALTADAAKLDPIDKLLQEEEAAELLKQQSQHRITPEACSVYCPAPISAAGSDTDRPLPMRLNQNYDATWSACDHTNHVRKQLQVNPALVNVADPNNVLVIRGAADGTTAAESCYAVKNAKQLWRSAHAAAPAEEDGSAPAAVPGQCMTAEVIEQACTPYHFNCTSPYVAGVSTAVAADEVVVTTHLRLTGLAYSSLAAHQEADLVAAFSSIFKIPIGSVSIAVVPPASSGFTFSLRSSISVQIYMRVKPLSGGLLPADLLRVISRVSSSKAVTAKIGQLAAYKLLVNSNLKNYILAILEHTNFKTVLAGAVLEADTNTKRSGWLVPTGVTIAGVTTLIGTISVAASEVSTTYRDSVDTLNADVCNAVYSSWSGYFGLGKNDPLTSSDLPHYQQGAWMLYALATGLLFITLIGAAVYLLRRYISREKPVRRTSSSNNINSGHNSGSNNGGNSSNTSTFSTSNQGTIAPNAESSVPPVITVATGSSAAHKTSSNSMWDKRRKVLQKFTVKR